MPIPKHWPLWRRPCAWLTWADFEQAIGDKPLHWWQRFFRWLLPATWK